MIINVRGSNGSGKSTLVRRVLSSFAEQRPVMADGRKRPLAYICSGGGLRRTAILGAYETPTGGCDTISKPDVIFGLAQTYADAGLDVLFEGIVAQHSGTRLLELARGRELRVIVLTTSDEECVASVRARREVRNERLVEEWDPRNVLKECRSVRSSTKRLVSEGVNVEHLDREAGHARVRELLADVKRPCQACGMDVWNSLAATRETHPGLAWHLECAPEEREH